MPCCGAKVKVGVILALSLSPAPSSLREKRNVGVTTGGRYAMAAA